MQKQDVMTKGKSSRKKKPFQVYWDEATQQGFDELVERYDALLPRATAVVKLIQYAIKEHWLPGYTKIEKQPAQPSQPRESKLMENQISKEVSHLKSPRTGFHMSHRNPILSQPKKLLTAVGVS